MTFLVATNVIDSRPPERRPTGTPHARANTFLWTVGSLNPGCSAICCRVSDSLLGNLLHHTPNTMKHKVNRIVNREII